MTTKKIKKGLIFYDENQIFELERLDGSINYLKSYNYIDINYNIPMYGFIDINSGEIYKEITDVAAEFNIVQERYYTNCKDTIIQYDRYNFYKLVEKIQHKVEVRIDPRDGKENYYLNSRYHDYDSKGFNRPNHRINYFTEKGIPDEGELKELGLDSYHKGQINHLDGKRYHNYCENLEITNNYFNQKHARENKLNPLNFEKEENVIQICELIEKFGDKYTISEIAEMVTNIDDFNIKDIKNLIYSIWRKGSYKNISKNFNFPEFNSDYFHKSLRTLSNEMVEFICLCIADGLTDSEITKKFEIRWSDGAKYDYMRKAVKRIRTKKAYKDISDLFF